MRTMYRENGSKTVITSRRLLSSFQPDLTIEIVGFWTENQGVGSARWLTYLVNADKEKLFLKSHATLTEAWGSVQYLRN